MTAAAWSPARAIAALLRACATEAETPRDGESEQDRLDRVLDAMVAFAEWRSPGHEGDVRFLLERRLRLPPTEVDRIIASVCGEPREPVASMLVHVCLEGDAHAHAMRALDMIHNRHDGESATTEHRIAACCLSAPHMLALDVVSIGADGMPVFALRGGK